MNYKVEHIPVNKYARSGKKLTSVRKIILHYTANPGASARNHKTYFTNLKDRYASAHIFIDKFEAIEIIPLSEVSYAANDVQKKNKDGSAYRGVKELLPNANLLSISIEMCVEKDGTIHSDTIKQSEEVAATLCKKFGLDQSDIVRHYDVTAKNCPAPFVKDSSKFDLFKLGVKGLLCEKKEEPKTPAKTVTNAKLVEVLVNDLNVRKSPNGTIVGQVNKGEVFTVKSVQGAWVELKSGLFISSSSKYVKFK